MKKALIVGINGQDGSFMAELLLEKGYEVYGVVRRSSTNNLWRIKHLIDNHSITLYYADLTDSLSLISVIGALIPDEIYNFGAQSDVKVSFDTPEYTSNVDGLGVLRILEAVRILDLTKKCRIYQSSTSELYGDTDFTIQDENTLFKPDSPYEASKLFAFNMCEIYKKAYGMFICNGILFNHESERRGEEFVTRKIVKKAVMISKGDNEPLVLGNIYAKRDWGYAKDYMEVVYQMMQQDVCDNYVIATGKQYTVKHFCNLVFNKLGIDLIWKGEGLEEIAINSQNNETIIKISSKLYRPIDVNNLCGNPKKACSLLNYNPNKTSLEDLVDIMIQYELERAKDYE